MEEWALAAMAIEPKHATLYIYSDADGSEKGIGGKLSVLVKRRDSVRILFLIIRGIGERGSAPPWASSCKLFAG